MEEQGDSKDHKSVGVDRTEKTSPVNTDSLLLTNPSKKNLSLAVTSAAEAA